MLFSSLWSPSSSGAVKDKHHSILLCLVTSTDLFVLHLRIKEGRWSRSRTLQSSRDRSSALERHRFSLTSLSALLLTKTSYISLTWPFRVDHIFKVQRARKSMMFHYNNLKRYIFDSKPPDRLLLFHVASSPVSVVHTPPPHLPHALFSSLLDSSPFKTQRAHTQHLFCTLETSNYTTYRR